MKVLIFLLAIFSSTFAISFNCTFSVYSHVIVGERYTCTAILSNYEDGPDLTEVTGSHLPLRNNSHVIGVTINSHLALNFIPQQMHTFFPVIGVLNIYNGNLTVIGENDLKDYINLEFLSLQGNKIVRIPGNFFANAPRMRYMNFNSNRIQHVGENLIEPLFALSQAHFSSNICVNYAVTNSSFPCLIGTLRVYCQDIMIETTTTPQTTDLPTSTTPEPVCDMHNSVCNIEDQTSDIKTSIDKLTEMMEELLITLTPP